MLTRGEIIYNQILRIAAFVTLLVATFFIGVILFAKWEYLKPAIVVCGVAAATLAVIALLFFGIVFIGLIYACGIKHRVSSANKLLVIYSVVALKLTQKILAKHGGLTVYTEEED